MAPAFLPCPLCYSCRSAIIGSSRAALRAGARHASNPAAANTATTPVASGASLVTVVTFQTVSGVIYTVESSTDGKVWSPVTTIVGDGSAKTISGSWVGGCEAMPR